ncbi:MAG: FecR family protein [Candidatus Riflebacteria bacterium]|nr:FecR family protein [Candidatus Riflebacteria bacterium]
MALERHKTWIIYLFLFAVAISSGGCGNKSSDLTAKIISITGKVELRQPATDKFIEAKQNDMLACGGILKTGDEASAQLEIIGKGIVELKSDTSFELEPGKDYVLQKAGAAIYKIEKNREGFKVKSPQGTTCVLGTRFLVKVLDTMTVVGVEEGSVSFTAGNGEVRTLKAKEKTIVDSNGFVGKTLAFDLSSDAFNYLQIDGKWVPKETVEK